MTENEMKVFIIIYLFLFLAFFMIALTLSQLYSIEKILFKEIILMSVIKRDKEV